MNNQCFDTLIYLRARPFKEQQALFEYFFDRKFLTINLLKPSV